MNQQLAHHPKLLQKIADELEQMRGETEALGADLCSDADVVMRHLNALQCLDRLAQTQLALAKILRADDPSEALSKTDLHSLRDRLMRAR